MHDPLVSFCFTTFKRAAYLKSTLESVLSQTYSNFEVVVSDNDPEGSGRTVVESFQDPRFKYYPNAENLGMKKSFNKSLERSTGEYIVMIADDDPVYPDMLETLIRLRREYPGYGMYLGGSNWYCTQPDIAQLYNVRVGMNSCLAYRKIDDVQKFSASEFLKGFFTLKIFPYYLWSTGMVERDIMIKMGGVPDYNSAFLGDYAYLSVMGSHSGCVAINRALGHQTIHEQNFGRAQNDQLKITANNFISYVSERIKGVEDWPLIEREMKHFVALWMVTHINFLRRYYSLFPAGGEIDFNSFEKELFSIPLMKPYKLKYLLKKHTPALHDSIVNVKRKMKSRR